jgi:hypothetical protein
LPLAKSNFSLCPFGEAYHIFLPCVKKDTLDKNRRKQTNEREFDEIQTRNETNDILRKKNK